MEEALHDKLLNLVKVDKSEMKNGGVSNKKSSKKNFKTTIKTKKTITKKNYKKN
jgi:putative lipoic acid-binding regulatory protein